MGPGPRTPRSPCGAVQANRCFAARAFGGKDPLRHAPHKALSFFSPSRPPNRGPAGPTSARGAPYGLNRHFAAAAALLGKDPLARPPVPPSAHAPHPGPARPPGAAGLRPPPEGCPASAERGYHERLFQNILKYHLGEPVSGLLLLYPRCILHILESSSGTLYHILHDLASLQKQGSCALLQEIKILVVSHNIPTRLFLQWYVTRVTLPVTYLEDVTQSQSAEEVVTECLTLLLKLGTYLSKTFKVSSKGLGDNLHTLVPELLIPAEIIEYLCKATEFMSPEAFLKMYNNPLQPAMASETVWPTPCHLYP
ncbi:testis-expressed protein 47-like isoform X2 [Carettochelys insculpta]|uniref:testis-expressed protein 47-like isoform X2 n=1 Tax=Carettochelys insculpta TaxID=44489 RepID=UPI003EBA42E0